MSTKDELRDRAWQLSGQMADQVRMLVGGQDLNGMRYAVANLESAVQIINRLRPILDEYDETIILMTQESSA